MNKSGMIFKCSSAQSHVLSQIPSQILARMCKEGVWRVGMNDLKVFVHGLGQQRTNEGVGGVYIPNPQKLAR